MLGRIHLSARLKTLCLRVNRGARALCLHVNRRPRSQPASQPASLAPSQLTARAFVTHFHANILYGTTSISDEGVAFPMLFLMKGCHFCYFDIEFLPKGLHF